MTTPKVTIIVPAYHQTELSVQLTIQCLTNITKYTDTDLYELIVIEDIPKHRLRDDFNVFRIKEHIILDKYTNYSTKMNIAAKKVTTPYICFVQNDCFVWEGWLDTLLEYFDKGLAQAMVPHQFGATREQIKQAQDMTLEQGLDMGSRDACMIFVTSEAYDKSGGFNDGLKAFVERDFYNRLDAAGIDVHTTNKVQVTHIALGTHYQDINELDRKIHHDTQIENEKLVGLDRRRRPDINKSILITGGSGSLGKALLRRINDSEYRIKVLSRSETGQIPLRNEFPNVEFVLGDIKDKLTLRQALQGIDIVIHAAAFKFIDLAEEQPREAVQTNVVGTLNLIEAIEEVGTVQQCLGVSTDKAVYARNVYGCTKHIMEKLFKEANKHSKTLYSCVRYGNVLNTTGSVKTIWEQQLAEGKPLTITDRRMRRFFFTLDEAIDLIFYALDEMDGGETFIIKMHSYSIYDMAKDMSDNVVEIGMRQGEKLNEVLIADYEGEEFTSENSGNNELVVLR